MCIRSARWVLLAALLGAASSANAFKIDTHLWLADHLLGEICSGSVRIDGRSIELPSQIRNSISRYPNAFRIGVLGADLYPDLVAGQMTTHPGLAPVLDEDGVSPTVAMMAAHFKRPITGRIRGWQTDDWLAFVRAEAIRVSDGKPTAEIAFAYGYLLHAAMDTWAHSYVNLYTGDLFSIVDNQEIAARHTAIEVYIKQAHEAYVKPLSQMAPNGCVGQPGIARAGGRSRGADNLSVHAAPTRFVRDTLILNPEAANQYARTPGAQHVYAMWLVWEAARRAAIDWEPVRGALDALLDQANTAVFQAEQAWQAADGAKRVAAAAAQQALAAKRNAEGAAVQAGQDFAGILGDVLTAFENNPAVQVTEATVESFLHLLPPPMRTAYYQARNAALDADKALDEAIDAYEAATDHSSELAAEALEAFEQLELKETARQAAHQARQMGWTAVDTSLDGWRRNIEMAVDAYVVAFEETAREIMRGSGTRFRKGANPTWPLKEWAACWGPLFGMPALPLPPEMAAETCQAGLSAYNNARQNLTLLKNNAAFDLLGLSDLKAPVEEYEEALHEQIRDGMPMAGQLLNASVGGGAEEIPGSASFMAVLWDKHVEADDLDREFAGDESGSNLPVYPPRGPGSASALLEQDQLPPAPGSGMAAMLQFPPVANALNLSRLTLLGGTGLNTLVRSYGIGASAYADGDPAYPPDALPGAVLVGAIRSIDGNHQWQPVAPPLPRRVWDADAIEPGRSVNLADGECRRFGYPAGGDYGGAPCAKDAEAANDPDFDEWLEAKHGFRLWFDPELRKGVFERIFTGPLSLAVCARLDDDVQYGVLGCGSPEYPPSLESQNSVAAFTETTGKRLASGRRAPDKVQRQPEMIRRRDEPVSRTPARQGGKTTTRPAAGAGSRQTTPAAVEPARRAEAVRRAVPAPRSKPVPQGRPVPQRETVPRRDSASQRQTVPQEEPDPRAKRVPRAQPAPRPPVTAEPSDDVGPAAKAEAERGPSKAPADSRFRDPRRQ